MCELRELDHRRNHGFEARLLWCERTGRVLVAVVEERTGRRFAVEVRDGEQPLDVLRHPHAYVVWHGTDSSDGTIEGAA